MNLVILDLKLPFDPIQVDLDIPLEDQLPPGPILEAARECVAKEAE